MPMRSLPNSASRAITTGAPLTIKAGKRIIQEVLKPDADLDTELCRKGRSFVEGPAEHSFGQNLVAAFAQDVARDSLPQVSWIVAPTAASEHPEAPPSIGENVTLIVQLAPIVKVVPQLLFWLKRFAFAPLMAILMPVSVAVPVFVTVTAVGALVEFLA